MINKLLALQGLDSQIFALRKEAGRLPQELEQLSTALAEKKALIEKEKEEVKKLRLAIHDAEVSLAEFDGKVAKFNVQANTVRKNDEYQAIMKEISSAKADKSRLEDKTLELYCKVEEHSEIEKQAEKELKSVEQEYASEKKRVDGEVARLTAEIDELAEKRKPIAGEGDMDTLAQYERILGNKDDGSALAFVETADTVDGEQTYNCRGCMAGITAQDVNMVMMGRQLITCRGCSRILYMPAGLEDSKIED